MTPATYSLSFSGQILQRGFWLYVWEISTPWQDKRYYVGRTGDSSSCNAQSPFNRMGQHLGANDKSNVLRRQLKKIGLDPELCTYRLIAHGPIMKEAASFEEHKGPRDIVAAIEKALAAALTEAGYYVINAVHSKGPVNEQLFEAVRLAFAQELPRLLSDEIDCTPQEFSPGTPFQI